MKYCDEILQWPLCLSTHIIKGKLKILETNLEPEEITNFYPIFCTFEDFYCDFVDNNLRHFMISILLVDIYIRKKTQNIGNTPEI